MDLTTMEIYNTFTKEKEEFVPQSTKNVTVYACGPTVYNFPHIGNHRSAATADLLVRVLTLNNYTVHFVSNITDVGHMTNDDFAQGDSGEDKMAVAARREKKSPYDIARFYEEAFLKNTKALHFSEPQEQPRATEHIDAMIKMITTLITKGNAYVSNGNVFYDVTTFSNYGKLSGNTLENLKVGARLTDKHPDKRHQWDFALWLKAPKDHVMQWESPWSIGYPGWHIECSAMSIQYLGDTIDIHLGGEDNIFPHHEAEIAQSECATGQQFSRYWMHTRHMLVDGKRMAKSKDNFYTLDDIEKKGFEAEDLRMLYLLSHYRSQMNFTWESLAQATKNRSSIISTVDRLQKHHQENTLGTEEIDTELIYKDFLDALCDDLNTPSALAVIFTLIAQINMMIDTKTLANTDSVLSLIDEMNSVLDITLQTESTTIPDAIYALAKDRDVARAAKDFTRADTLRDKITAAGYIATDTPDGTIVSEK